LHKEGWTLVLQDLFAEVQYLTPLNIGFYLYRRIGWRGRAADSCGISGRLVQALPVSRLEEQVSVISRITVKIAQIEEKNSPI
jgi:hypothetical protein